jgi:hypothetical protein
MPVTIHSLDEARGILVRGWGRVDDAEFLAAHLTHFSADPEFLSLQWYAIANWSGLLDTDIAPASLKAVAQLCVAAARVNPHVLLAMVGSGDLPYGLSRMFEVLAEDTGWAMESFRDEPAARRWIQEQIAERHGREVAFRKDPVAIWETAGSA